MRNEKLYPYFVGTDVLDGPSKGNEKYGNSKFGIRNSKLYPNFVGTDVPGGPGKGNEKC